MTSSRASARVCVLLTVACAICPGACVATEAGTSLQWNLAMGAGAPTSGEVFVGEQVLAVELDHALLSVASLELIPCDNTLTALRSWMTPVSSARAHGGVTPTRMATPHVIDLLARTESGWANAVSRPPPGEYCWARVAIGPADRDAVSAPNEPPLIDAALSVRGRYGAAGSAATVPFSVSSARTQSVDVALVDSNMQPVALILNDENRQVAVDVWFARPPLLDGVDPTAGVEALDGLLVIDNVLTAVHARYRSASGGELGELALQ